MRGLDIAGAWLDMLVLCLITVLAAHLLTAGVRRYAIARLLDIPNARSSHQVPTPRGGGVAIVLSFLGALAYLSLQEVLPLRWATALIGGGFWVALIGFLDDHRHVAAGWRLMAHFAGAACILGGAGGMPQIIQFETAIPVWLWQGLGAVYLVWLLNLYNFMDGIDGIAGIEAVSTCLGGAALSWQLCPDAVVLWGLPLCLGAASAGFLVWNFPPARIFMGDAGSGFLGLMLGAFSVLGGLHAPELFWAWVILLGVFIVDATLTLIHRLLRGECFFEAHRSHAYQHAAQCLGAHRPVSLLVGLINLLWLFPVAALVATGQLAGVLGVAIAYLPLVLLALHFKAGT